MALLAAEQHLTASAIAAIVRESDETVRLWLKRYRAEGVDGLHDPQRACQSPRRLPGAVAPSVLLPCASVVLHMRQRRSNIDPYSPGHDEHELAGP
jgi:hypothetical protein